MEIVWKWIVILILSHWFGNAAPFVSAILIGESAFHTNIRAACDGFLVAILLMCGIRGLVVEFKARKRYYELIGIDGVIGVCSPTNDEGLAMTLREDYIKAAGKINRKQFESFGDHPWTAPISRKRYVVRVKNAVRMERTKFRCPSDLVMDRE